MIETARLLLREWRETDLDAFAAICADVEVMRHLGGPATRQDVAAMIARQQAVQGAQGHCFWAVTRQDDDALIGFCGLRIGGHAGTPVPDELEIGWRLARGAWGHGFAREAATACLDWAWAKTRRARVTAWTVPANAASWGLMRRLGMTHRPELDFGHPAFAPGHPLHAHVTYAIDRAG